MVPKGPPTALAAATLSALEVGRLPPVVIVPTGTPRLARRVAPGSTPDPVQRWSGWRARFRTILPRSRHDYPWLEQLVLVASISRPSHEGFEKRGRYDTKAAETLDHSTWGQGGPIEFVYIGGLRTKQMPVAKEAERRREDALANFPAIQANARKLRAEA